MQKLCLVGSTVGDGMVVSWQAIGQGCSVLPLTSRMFSSSSCVILLPHLGGNHVISAGHDRSFRADVWAWLKPGKQVVWH